MNPDEKKVEEGTEKIVTTPVEGDVVEESTEEVVTPSDEEVVA